MEHCHNGLILAIRAKEKGKRLSLLGTNPRAEFVCNFPQEIYRGTSLPAAVSSLESSLFSISRSERRTTAFAPGAFAFLFPFFLSIHPLFLATLSHHLLEKRKNVVSSRTVVGLPSSRIGDAKAKRRKGWLTEGVGCRGSRRRPSLHPAPQILHPPLSSFCRCYRLSFSWLSPQPSPSGSRGRLKRGREGGIVCLR